MECRKPYKKRMKRKDKVKKGLANLYVLFLTASGAAPERHDRWNAGEAGESGAAFEPPGFGVPGFNVLVVDAVLELTEQIGLATALFQLI